MDVRSRALENMVSARPAAWKGRSVLVTGHTGFKGGWLAFWLAQLGARVTGYALAPSDGPSFFAAINLGSVVHDRRGDVRDVEATRAAVHEAAPDDRKSVV